MSFKPEAEAAARRHFKSARDRRIFVRQMGAEANFRDATSPAGAQGPAQIMPDTARGWGVRNVHDPREAYNAAAKAMAGYLRSYKGDWRKALAAYNAGTGAVAKYGGVPPFAETQAYVKKILGGLDARSKQGAAAPAGGEPSGGGRLRSMSVPGRLSPQDQLPEVLAMLQGKQGAGDMALKLASMEAALPAEQTLYRTRGGGGGDSSPNGSPGGSGRGPGDPLSVSELFWQGQGGINLKNGQKVPQGFVSGHTDHVHFASQDPRSVLRAGRLAKKMGLHVGENPAFGDPADPGDHTDTSYHYRTKKFRGRKVGEAIDVSGDPQAMAKYASRVAELAARRR